MHDHPKLLLFFIGISLIFSEFVPWMHRRRIKTEEKAKVIASVWLEEFIQFLAVLAVLPTTFE